MVSPQARDVTGKPPHLEIAPSPGVQHDRGPVAVELVVDPHSVPSDDGHEEPRQGTYGEGKKLGLEPAEPVREWVGIARDGVTGGGASTSRPHPPDPGLELRLPALEQLLERG